ncbi:DUF2637 domain-containing protein [Nonomuraea sp. NBC_00507]|uniref:DUF2637 domain-containing protein n=1 Tax=Nonomuraea sp. NBC_00507 TaxID=2976002 RepID=UPI002E17F6E1
MQQPNNLGHAALNLDAIIKWSTIVVVLLLAAIAAIVSYRHAHELVSAYGETGITAALVPLTVDGLVYASSMVLLQAARLARPAPLLARLLLAVGILATLGANVAHGWGTGLIGAIVSAWPAVALVGSYELLMWLLRADARPATDRAEPDVDQEALAVYRASIESGEPLSQRELARRFGRSRRWAAGIAEQANETGSENSEDRTATSA